MLMGEAGCGVYRNSVPSSQPSCKPKTILKSKFKKKKRPLATDLIKKTFIFVLYDIQIQIIYLYIHVHFISLDYKCHVGGDFLLLLHQCLAHSM